MTMDHLDAGLIVCAANCCELCAAEWKPDVASWLRRRTNSDSDASSEEYCGSVIFPCVVNRDTVPSPPPFPCHVAGASC